MKESLQNSQENQSEREKIKKERFRIKDMSSAFPHWELNDEIIKNAAKSYLKKEEINVVSWKKLGVDVKNGVKWWGIEFEYSEK